MNEDVFGTKYLQACFFDAVAVIIILEKTAAKSFVKKADPTESGL